MRYNNVGRARDELHMVCARVAHVRGAHACMCVRVRVYTHYTPSHTHARTHTHCPSYDGVYPEGRDLTDTTSVNKAIAPRRHLKETQICVGLNSLSKFLGFS